MIIASAIRIIISLPIAWRLLPNSPPRVLTGGAEVVAALNDVSPVASCYEPSWPRQAVFDKVLPHPFVRKVIFRLPKFLQPAPERYSFVVALDSQGRVVENLQNGSPDCYGQIANVVEHNGKLYFGSIGEDTVGVYALQ